MSSPIYQKYDYCHMTQVTPEQLKSDGGEKSLQRRTKSHVTWYFQVKIEQSTRDTLLQLQEDIIKCEKKKNYTTSSRHFER